MYLFIKISEDTEGGHQICWMTLGFKKTSADGSDGLNMKFNRNKPRVLGLQNIHAAGVYRVAFMLGHLC